MTTVFKKLDEQIIELADTIAREMRKVLELAKTKADKTETTTALGTKADKSTAATKAELQEVSSNVLLKADKSYVDTQLASKVDQLYVGNAIAGKADTTSVNTELAKKANATDVSTALSEMEAEKVGYTVQTAITDTQRENARTNIGWAAAFTASFGTAIAAWVTASFNSLVEAYLVPILKQLCLDNGATQAEIDALEAEETSES